MMNMQSPTKGVDVCGKECYNASVMPAKAGLFGQFKEYFTKLFDTADWPPRWHCGNWTDFHGWLYIIADLMIGIAYFAIPILLIRIIIKKDTPFTKLFWLFIAFIALCGSTHVIDALIFWWPAYRLSALIRFLTGLVSIFTVCILYKSWPMIYSIRTQKQLEAEIEERKKAEQEARHQQILKETTEELMKKKDEFMSIASHELKTPITTVKGLLQLVERVVVKEPTLQQVAPMVQKASRQVNKLTGLVNDLLDVTKIQAGKLVLIQTEFVLLDLIEECIEQCQIGETQHEIFISGDPGLVIFADRNRLEQVICNLITNAIKYSPNGKELNIIYKGLSGSGVKVEVIDNGIGIPEQELINIFDRFFRVEHTSQNFSGLGLGLYISSEIIKHHHGSIGVESKQGVGSKFWFNLP
ncbi:MAG: HAMP domain-containing histidine kinase [Pedobacter sp.]|nr:HAMP domain-containing histidine kinase [Pedobacter sp.]